jgi:hypothetical protein
MNQPKKQYTAEEIEAAMRDINETRKRNQLKEQKETLHRKRKRINPYYDQPKQIDFDNIDSYDIQSLSNMHRKFKLNLRSANDLNKKQWLKEKLSIIHQAQLKKDSTMSRLAKLKIPSDAIAQNTIGPTHN